MPETLDLVYEIVKETRDDVKDLTKEVVAQNGRIIVLEEQVKLRSKLGAVLIVGLPPITAAAYLFLQQHV